MCVCVCGVCVLHVCVCVCEGESERVCVRERARFMATIDMLCMHDTCSAQGYEFRVQGVGSASSIPA